ncbi:hypothetical protein [Acaryochloris marina]|uniref:Uncharacterized protein n=1 Tax=Acaryochloris marina (strain MBIC 11017) TaxID=329726 RepID=B0CCU1_ACAM1|nr:hypothetical protein [Acaryochloris marina]ABW30383.1 hypothetical protein AM1_5427 [Acaryochloris marina MBIC11017]BDM79204.1 hypothetical protein AM10699_20720 [Acaryochloris marina MBIC10699]
MSSCKEITQIQTQNKYLNATLKPGVGFGDINLRSTSLREITAQLGRNYKRKVRGLTEHKCEDGVCTSGRLEIITLNYKSQGLQFMFEQRVNQLKREGALPLKEIRVNCIKDKCPYKGKTEQGIGLGDTRKQIKEAYGNPKRSPTNTWQWSYPKKGISFEIDKKYGDPVQDSDRIKTIVISKDLR